MNQAQLSLADIESYAGQGPGQQSGGRLRYKCPVHGGDNQRSLSLDAETGHFKCFACGAWGYIAEKRMEWIEEKRREEAWRKPLPKEQRAAGRPPAVPVSPPRPQPTPKPELAQLLVELQDLLPGSWGEGYLEHRRIPLDLAKRYGVGYAPDGKWAHHKGGDPDAPLVRQWRFGRLVFPHTNPAGEVVNLYGRAVGSNEKVPKQDRHDHLPGLKGAFNARALHCEHVFICEGVFDALSLMAAGHGEACAIYGVDGLRWDWVKAKKITLALDQDAAGQREWQQLAREAILLGKEVYFLAPEAYAGHKDLNEAWVSTGKLDIGDWEAEEWNESLADSLLQGAMMQLTTVHDATTTHTDLLEALEKAEAEMNAAYQRNDMKTLREAVSAYEGAVHTLTVT